MIVNTPHIILVLAAVLSACYLWPTREVYQVEGKTALVTGASSGLGAATAMELAAEGVSKLAICARRLDKLEQVKSRILEKHSNVQVTVYSCDLGDNESIQALKDNVLKDYGHVDILVQNAGIEKKYYFEKDSVESITKQTNVNCLGTLLVVHAFLPQMVERGSGSVIVMSSMGGKLGMAYFAAYSANRFCATGFASGLRYEMLHRQTGVHVGSIHPGFVQDEGMYADLLQSEAPATHWIFGSGGTAEGIGQAVVHQIKTREPERLVNYPSLRPVVVLSQLFPPAMDAMVKYCPSCFDPSRIWAEKSMIEEGVKFQ